MADTLKVSKEKKIEIKIAATGGDQAAAEVKKVDAAIGSTPAALLVGGLRHGLNMDDAWFDALLAQIERWQQRDGGALLITLTVLIINIVARVFFREKSAGH